MNSFSSRLSSVVVSLPVALQSHLDHLYEQIDDLSLQLAEERLNHRQTRLAGEERLSGELSKATKGFEEMFNRRMFDHQKEVEEEKEKCRRSLADERTASLQREEHLKSELEFVKNSFHSYKVTVLLFTPVDKQRRRI